MRRTTALLGLGLAAAAAGWTAVAADRNAGSRPGPVLAAIGAAAAASVVGALLARVHPLVPAGAVAVAAGVAAVLALPDRSAPDGGPFGYANATGSLLALGSLGAAAMAATRWFTPGRVLAGVAGAGLVASVVVSGSAAALAVLPLGAVVALVGRRSSGAAAVVGGAVVVVVLGVTVALGAGGSGREPVGSVGTRVALWHGALETAREHPVTGVGPGRFEVVNPVTDDRDIRFAHHGLLQQAAEQGVVGAGLLLGAFALGFVRAGRTPWPAGPLAAAALTVVAVHASVDHVLRYAAVTATLALLVGGSVPSPHHPRPRRSATSR